MARTSRPCPGCGRDPTIQWHRLDGQWRKSKARGRYSMREAGTVCRSCQELRQLGLEEKRRRRRLAGQKEKGEVFEIPHDARRMEGIVRERVGQMELRIATAVLEMLKQFPLVEEKPHTRPIHGDMDSLSYGCSGEFRLMPRKVFDAARLILPTVSHIAQVAKSEGEKHGHDFLNALAEGKLRHDSRFRPDALPDRGGQGWHETLWKRFKGA